MAQCQHSHIDMIGAMDHIHGHNDRQPTLHGRRLQPQNMRLTIQNLSLVTLGQITFNPHRSLNGTNPKEQKCTIIKY